MLRRVQQYIQQHGLLQKGERVLVCVSGGADSMALLDVLQRGGYDCVVAHCNFHLRGEESDRDEQVVRQSALLTTKNHRTIPLFVKHFDTIAYAQEQRCSIEVAARNLRYEWFAQLAKELEFTILGLTFSPVKGPEGNIEFLGHLTLADREGIEPDTGRVVEEAHRTLKG